MAGRSAALSLLAWLVLALAWTWPAAGTPDLVGLHPDAAGTVWFLHAAPGLEGTGHPVGVTYGRPDSWLLMLWALLPVGPVRLHAWLGVLGVAVSAWAAEGFARAVGARQPWSMLAGLSFAFCGLSATALLEGYVYHVMNPWLPLLGWAWWRATKSDGRPIHGLAAGAAWTACLLTTAYLGLAGAVMVVAMAAARARALSWRPLAAAAVVAVPAGAVYTALFLSAEGGGGLAGGSAAPLADQLPRILLRMAAPLADTDIVDVSQAPAILGTTLVLAAVAPRVLRRRRGWGAVAVAAVVGLGLAFLPRLGGDGFVAQALLRFPDRLGWVWQLCGGVLAAQVLSELAERGRAAWPLLGCGLVDAFLVVGLPARQGTQVGEVPSVYAAADTPVLDLWPDGSFRDPRWTLWTTNVDCFYQTQHHRPIADHCIFTPDQPSPRITRSQELVESLLRSEPVSVEPPLTLVLHADAFRPHERAALMEGLAQLDPVPEESTDGGEWLLAYTVR